MKNPIKGSESVLLKLGKGKVGRIGAGGCEGDSTPPAFR